MLALHHAQFDMISLPLDECLSSIMLESWNRRCQREFWCWEVGCYSSSLAILKDTSCLSPPPKQPVLSPGVVPMELLKGSYIEIQRHTKPGLVYCTGRWCACVGSILIWTGRDLWRSRFKSQFNSVSASILYSAIVLMCLLSQIRAGNKEWSAVTS